MPPRPYSTWCLPSGGSALNRLRRSARYDSRPLKCGLRWYGTSQSRSPVAGSADGEIMLAIDAVPQLDANGARTLLCRDCRKFVLGRQTTSGVKASRACPVSVRAEEEEQ